VILTIKKERFVINHLRLVNHFCIQWCIPSYLEKFVLIKTFSTMRTTIFFTLFIVFLNSFLFGQQTHVLRSEYFNDPEAIIYDSELKRYIVGNAGDGKIFTVDSLEAVSPFLDTIGAELVMSFEIIGDSLFATTNDPLTVTCLNRITGENIYQLNMDSLTGSFSQTVVDPRNNDIYVVMQQGAVYKVIPNRAQIWKFADDGLGTSSQTVEIDTVQNRLMIFSFNNPYVTFINLNDSTDVERGPHIGSYQNTASVATPDGYVYLSTWSGNRIRRFHRDSIGETITFCDDSVRQPVSITFNPDKKELATCNFGNNTVTIIEFETDDPTGIGNAFLNSKGAKIYQPMHTKEIVISLQNPDEEISAISFYNSVGQLVLQLNEPSFYNNESLHLDCSALPLGFYIVSVSNESHVIGSAKLMFH
jgi:hypothetical protein